MDRRSSVVGSPLRKNTLQVGPGQLTNGGSQSHSATLPVASGGSTPPQVTGQLLRLRTVAATTSSKCTLLLLSTCPHVDIAYLEPICLHTFRWVRTRSGSLCP